MLKWINRIRNFDFRSLKPWQIVALIAAAIVTLYIIVQLLQLVLTLLPIILVAVGLYFGYRWLMSRSEDIPEEAKMSRNEKVVNEALQNVEEAQQASRLQPDDERAEFEAVRPYEEINDEGLVVRQVVNPETGFKEPDIVGLEEREKRLLAEIDENQDDIAAQLEARRRRLREQQGGGSDDS